MPTSKRFSSNSQMRAVLETLRPSLNLRLPHCFYLVGSSCQSAGHVAKIKCRNFEVIGRDILRRIVSARMPRMAAANTTNALKRADDGSVFLNGPDEIVAASRLEPTLSANNRAERVLVDSRQ